MKTYTLNTYLTPREICSIVAASVASSAMKLKHALALHACTIILAIESAQISIISFWICGDVYRTEGGALVKCASSIGSRLATDFR